MELYPFLLVSISLYSGFFSFGAAAFLYLKYRTRIVRLVALFLVSLLSINLGFWFLLFPVGKIETFQIVATLFSLTGLLLNIGVVPLLIASLISLPLGKFHYMVLYLWISLFSLWCLLFFLTPAGELFLTIINMQLLLTIALSLAILFLRMGEISEEALRKSVKGFFWISLCFLILLSLDILVSRLSIESLRFLDNLSLPIYFFALNVGSFFFAVPLFGKEALMEEGKITETFRSEFGLTDRESELIELLWEGYTNREISEHLFISVKTVENHLYNIYQKMGVRNRLQLVGALHNRSKNR
jgi:DNA-binding CsgD family transcriptional regulator